MAVLNWGKPTIEYVKYVDGKLPDNPVWLAMPTAVEGTVTMETAEGEKKEAKEEGGAIVDSYTSKSSYTLSFELFEKKGSEKPIEDEDGVVLDNYAFRIIPEDETNNGYIMKKTSVTSLQTYNAADGGRWKYTVSALKPDDGSKMLDRFIKSN